jgi:mycothiol synthase
MTAPPGLPGAERPLTDDEVPALRALMLRCLEVDGGLSLAATDEFLLSRFRAGPGVARLADDGSMLAVAAVAARDPRRTDGATVGGRVRAAGLVDPSVRGRGVGRWLLDWTVAAAAGAPWEVASENVSESALRLYARYGLTEVFAELVMIRDLTGAPAVVPPPSGVTFRAWDESTVSAFFTAYSRSFADRPGFPGLSVAEWQSGYTDDEEFRPDLSLVAMDPEGEPAGFATVGENWIGQIGVVPAWRRRGLGSALVTAALAGISQAGYGWGGLTVATNNPAAIALYGRLGFTVAGRRGRFASP